MRLGVEGPLPLRSSALLPRNLTTSTYYRLAYFYSATLAWFYSALDRPLVLMEQLNECAVKTRGGSAELRRGMTGSPVPLGPPTSQRCAYFACCSPTTRWRYV